MAYGPPEQAEQHAAKAARRLNAIFKNDEYWCMHNMTAEGRLLAFNVIDDPSQVIVIGPQPASAVVVLKVGQHDLKFPVPSSQGLKRLPSSSHVTEAPAPITQTSTPKRNTVQVKDIVVYGEDVSDETILSGDTEQIRGLNVLRLASKYSDTGLARAINGAQPPGTIPLSVDNIYERVKSACRYVAKARSGTDTLWEEVREEMVYVPRRANGLLVKKRGGGGKGARSASSGILRTEEANSSRTPYEVLS